MNEVHYLSSTYIKLLVQANQELVAPIEGALGKPLLTFLSKPFIDGHVVEELINLFHHLGLDSWVLRHSKQLGISSHGPLGFAVLTAPDLESAIQVAADYSIIRISYYDCQFRHINNRAEFTFESQTSSPLINQWMIESGVHVVKQLIETIVAHPLGSNAQVHFEHPEPPYQSELEAFYGTSCQFNQKANLISIPSSWCEISSPLSEPATFNSNLRKCFELKKQLSGQQDIVNATRLALNNYFKELNINRPTKIPSLNSLAKDNHMVVRTFARHLEKYGYTYRQLLEEVRQQHACDLLKNTHMNISDISAQLGYQETANFIRAFKSWFTCTPTQWRRNNT